jgi:hypothetical protein
MFDLVFTRWPFPRGHGVRTGKEGINDADVQFGTRKEMTEQIKHRLKRRWCTGRWFPRDPVHTTKLDTHLRKIILHNNGQLSVSSAGHHADLRLQPAFAMAFIMSATFFLGYQVLRAPIIPILGILIHVDTGY